MAALRSAADEPDTRAVIAAFDLLDEENKVAPTIPAAAGFSVLAIFYDGPETRRVAGFTTHPVIGWRLVNDGESPLPITFSLHTPYHAMCHLAVQSPDGSVCGFEGGWFPSAAEWLRNRRRELRRRR
jgi:hypothetical protein